jgi:hypothetical protein
VRPQGATPELGGRKLWPSSSSVPSRALHQGRSPQKGVRRALDLRHRCQECPTPLLRTSRTIQGALSIGAFVATMVYTYTSKSAKDEDAALFDWDEAMSRMFEATASNSTRRKKPYWIPVGFLPPPTTLVSRRVWHPTGRSVGIGHKASDCGQ